MPAPNLSAFLGLGFRPLYLGGTAWALIATAMWIYAPQLLTGPLQGIAWHVHEMLSGFVATIAVGFLMTAGANWTASTRCTAAGTARGGDYAMLMQRFNAGLLMTAMVALLIARRVIPFFGMTARIALGHLGRALAADRSMVESCPLVLTDAALRLAAVVPGRLNQLLPKLAAAAWIAAFALFVALRAFADSAERLAVTATSSAFAESP